MNVLERRLTQKQEKNQPSAADPPPPEPWRMRFLLATAKPCIADCLELKVGEKFGLAPYRDDIEKGFWIS